MKLLCLLILFIIVDSVQFELLLFVFEVLLLLQLLDVFFFVLFVFDFFIVLFGFNQCCLMLGECVLIYNFKCLLWCIIGFVIDDCGLLIMVLCWVIFVEIEYVIVEKQKWIFVKLVEWCVNVVCCMLLFMEWQDGVGLLFFGKMIMFKLELLIGVLMFDVDISMLYLGLLFSIIEQQIKDCV